MAESLPLPDPPLTDGRCTLRPWEPGDLQNLLAGSADPLVRRFRYSLPEDGEQAWLWLAATVADRERGERLELAVTDRTPTAPVVGSVSLQRVHRRRRNGFVSYWLSAPGRGRGLGTAAVRLLAGWAFGELGLERLALELEVANLASQRLAERCGFAREGRLRSEQRLRDGTRADVFVYGLLRGDSHR